MYKFIRWISILREKHTKKYLLVVIIITNFYLWFLSASLTYILEPKLFESFFDSLTKSSIYWMLGYLDPSLPTSIRIISLITLMLSMIIFSGGIIAYISALFTTVIDNAKYGKGPVYFENHIIILNWNQKAIELINNYSFKERKVDIVILSSTEKEIILSELNEVLKATKNINLIIRVGDIFSVENLKLIKIEEAKSIIILSNELNEMNLEQQDIFNLKILMLLNNELHHIGTTVIVELKNRKMNSIINNQLLTRTNKNTKVKTILSNQWMGYLIAQTILIPELHQVYAEVLSYEGAEFYARKISDENALDENYIESNSIPLYKIGEYKYYFAEHEKDINKKIPLKQTFKDIKFVTKSRIFSKKVIVIFGNNRKIDFIKESIETFELENKINIEIYHFEDVPEDKVEEKLKEIKHIDHILLLSNDQEHHHDIDSNVLITLLLINKYISKYKANLIVELHDPKNYEIVKNYNVSNTILSNKYLSHIISSISGDINISPLIWDLLSYDGNDTYEIYIYPVNELIDEKFPLAFDSKLDLIHSIINSSDGDIIPIGRVKDGFMETFKGDLDKKETYYLNEDDKLIVISK